MTELERVLSEILTEKEEKIIPENIKKGVTIFNVEGTVESIIEGDKYPVKASFNGEYTELNETIANAKIENFKVEGNSFRLSSKSILHTMYDLKIKIKKPSLFSLGNTERTINGVTFTPCEDGGVILNGTATATARYPLAIDADTNSRTIELEANTEYIYDVNSTSSAYSVNFYFPMTVNGTLEYFVAPCTFTTGEAVPAGAYIQVEEGSVLSNVKLYAQLEKGTEIVEQSVRFPLGLQALPLKSYLAEDGIHLNREIVVFDGTETWHYNRTNGDCTIFYKTFSSQDRDLVCTHFPNFTEIDDLLNNEYVLEWGQLGSVDISISNDKLADVTTPALAMASFKAFLATEYENGTPVSIERTIDETIIPYNSGQQAAWEDLQILTTLNDVTVITSECLVPAILSGEVTINATIEYDCYDNSLSLVNDILDGTPSYTQLTYIEGTGTQYIDTGIIPTNHTTEIRFAFTNMDNNKTLFGSSYYDYHFTWYLQRWYYACGEGDINIEGTCTNLQTLTFNNTDKQLIINGTVSGTTGGVSPAIDNLCLFRRGPNGDTGNSCVRLYYCKIYNRYNGNIIRDYIPVRTVDGVICLYDKVTNSYFYNSGTGDFIAGEEV